MISGHDAQKGRRSRSGDRELLTRGRGHLNSVVLHPMIRTLVLASSLGLAIAGSASTAKTATVTDSADEKRTALLRGASLPPGQPASQPHAADAAQADPAVSGDAAHEAAGSAAADSATGVGPANAAQAHSTKTKLRAAEKKDADDKAAAKHAAAEKEKDEAALAEDGPITGDEYAEAHASANIMVRKDNGCGHAYCEELLHYKQGLQPDDAFLDTCIKAHRAWENEQMYSLSCDPHNPVRLAAEAADELTRRTMVLINKKRQHQDSRRAETYAADTIAAGKKKMEQDVDIEAGREQRAAVKALGKRIDLAAHIQKKEIQAVVMVRCKDNEKVDSVYSHEAGLERVPDCVEKPVQGAVTSPYQGYIRIDREDELEKAIDDTNRVQAVHTRR